MPALRSGSYLSTDDSEYYSDEDDEEVLLFHSAHSRSAPSSHGGGGGGRSTSGGGGGGAGRPGGRRGRGQGPPSRSRLARARMSNGHVRSRIDTLLDGDEELLAAERQTNCWLTVAVLGLMVACGFLLYDRVAVERGAAGHAFLEGGPNKLSSGGRGKGGGKGGGKAGAGGGKGGKGAAGRGGFEGDARPDDDWYDDKFQREVPNLKHTASASQLAHASTPTNKGTTRAEEKTAKDLIKKVYEEEEEDSMEEEDGDEGDAADDGGEPSKTQSKSAPKSKPEKEPAAEEDEFAAEAESATGEVSSAEAAMARLSTYAPWNVPYKPGTDLAVYWHVPMSAGTTLEDILTHCYGLVEANEIGITMGHGSDEELMILEFEDGGQYVNVDTTTREGIARAKRMGLAPSQLADVVLTPYLHDAASLFRDTSHRGKCLALLRHPVQRAVSMFYYLKSNSPADSPLHSMTVEEYADSPYCEENWMTRFLVDKPEGVLMWHHLDLAKSVLGRKCLVGLVEQFEESLRRFERYFGWSDIPEKTLGERSDCEQRLVKEGDNRHEHPTYEEGSDVWELLKKKNGYDLMLYEYARDLFRKQKMYTDEEKGV